MTTQEFINYCLNIYDTSPDYPFDEDFVTAVLRHGDEVIDVSCQSRCPAPLVKDSFEDYILILRHLWNDPLYKVATTKQMLCTDWDGKVVERVLEAVNG